MQIQETVHFDAFNPEDANHDCSRRQSWIFFHCLSEKIRLDISCESSARQRIHMNLQVLFSLKEKSDENKSVVCCNLAWQAF